MERQRHSALAGRVGDGVIAFFAAESFDDERLEVRGGEVVADLYAAGEHFADEGIPLVDGVAALQADDIDKPAHSGVGRFGGNDDARLVGQQGGVHPRHGGAFFDEFPRELDDAEGAVDVGHAVVVAHPLMGQPAGAPAAALITERIAQLGQVFVVGDDHPAFAGGHLLVGIEGKHADVAEGAGFAAVQGRAECLAAVFDDGQTVFLGDIVNLVHTRRVAKDLDGNNRFGVGGDLTSSLAGSRFRLTGSISANTGVAPTIRIKLMVAMKVNEVVMTSSPGPRPVLRAEEQTAGAAVDGDGVFAADILLKRRLEFPQFGAEGQVGAQDLTDRVDFRFSNIRPR